MASPTWLGSIWLPLLVSLLVMAGLFSMLSNIWESQAARCTDTKRMPDRLLKSKAIAASQTSLGGWDAHAKAGLDMTSDLRDLTMDDHHRLAALVQYNSPGGKGYVAAVSRHFLNASRARMETLPVKAVYGWAPATRALVVKRGTEFAKKAQQTLAITGHVEADLARTLTLLADQAPVFPDGGALSVISSDANSAMDSAVVRRHKAMIKALKWANNESQSNGAVTAEVKTWLSVRLLPERQRGLRALNQINVNAYCTSFGCTDRDVLTMVWARGTLADNAKTRTSLKRSVVDALCDMVDPVDTQNIVCISGRIGLLLESLAVLDSEFGVQVALTWEWVCNDVVRRCAEVAAEASLETTDSQLAKAFQDIVTSRRSLLTDSECDQLTKYVFSAIAV